jgi:hypothetical protein
MTAAAESLRHEPRAVHLSLVSHTNAGKTTLVRTLLQRDVGEVRDAAHVTEVATGYPLLQHAGDTLMLWDTPGFGDTARLAGRLRQAGNPIGWLLSQVWDRFRERPLWSSQQAVRNAREEADVILYLVNASEHPAGAAYVPMEMEILDWIGKPILLLLNQTGPPGEESRADEDQWRNLLASNPLIKGALTLDAFARCWVQERTLLDIVTSVLPPDKQETMRVLIGTWTERNLERFRASMSVLAKQLASAAMDRERIGDKKWRDVVVGAVLNPAGGDASAAGQRAMGELAERLHVGIRQSTDELIALHGLSGQAAQEVLSRVEKDYIESAPARPGIAAVLGGLVSGAAGGLAADVAAGGLTLGGGMIVGGILGAVGAGSVAKTYNLARGEETNAVRWSEIFFTELVRSSLLRYLAVAHYGRGRGDWEEGEHPASWQAAVNEEVEREQKHIRKLWNSTRDAEVLQLESDLDWIVTMMAERLLMRFYPQSGELFEK